MSFKTIDKNSRYLIFASAFAIFIMILLFTKSISIATPFSLLFALAFSNLIIQRMKKRENILTETWPEAIDHIISGLHAGRSLTETLITLADRGPTIIRPFFKTFKANLLSGKTFESCLEELREQLAHHGSDQVIEALLLAKNLGGGELINLLRIVGDFQRQDLSLNKEILIKQGWIKNSAHLAAAAPWILLLMLSSQTTTAAAFGTAPGISILIFGFALTILAYLWMNHLSKLPKSPRVFNLKKGSHDQKTTKTNNPISDSRIRLIKS